MTAPTKCPRRHCGLALDTVIDALGRTRLVCRGCERNARGLCRDCPRRLARHVGPGGQPMRCAACQRRRQSYHTRIYQWRTKGLDEAAITRKLLGCCDAFARRIPNRRPKQRYCASCAHARLLDQFRRHDRKRSGTPHRKAWTRANRAKHRDRIRARDRMRYRRERERRIAWQLDYYHRNRDAIRAQRRARRERLRAERARSQERAA